MPSVQVPSNVVLPGGGPKPQSGTSLAVQAKITAHLTDPVDAHDASAISYAGGANWADGTTNPATSVELQIDKILTELGSGDGLGKIAYNGGANWADGTANPAATAGAQIDKIITDLAGATGAAKVGIAVAATWAGGMEGIAATTVDGAIEEVVSDLGGAGGAARIGLSAVGNWANGDNISSGELQTAISVIIAQLADSMGVAQDGASRVGFTAQGNLAATNVGAAIVELDTEKGGLATINTWAAANTFDGQVEFGNGLWPNLDGFTAVERHQALIIVGSQTATSASVSWNIGTPVVDSPSNLGVADAFLLDLSSIPDGAEMVSVKVMTIGLGANNDPANKATYVIQRQDGDTAFQAMSLTTADTHTYGAMGNWLTTNVETTVNVNATAIVDKSSFTYFLRVNSPFDGGVGSTGIRVTRIIITYNLPVLKV